MIYSICNMEKDGQQSKDYRYVKNFCDARDRSWKASNFYSCQHLKKKLWICFSKLEIGRMSCLGWVENYWIEWELSILTVILEMRSWIIVLPKAKWWASEWYLTSLIVVHCVTISHIYCRCWRKTCLVYCCVWHGNPFQNEATDHLRKIL